MFSVVVVLVLQVWVGLVRSGNFDKAWSEYVEWFDLHKQDFHLDLHSGFGPNNSGSGNYYLLWTGHDNKTAQKLEDRWLAITAAMVYAMLTKRLFFIDADHFNLDLFPGLTRFRLPVQREELPDHTTALDPHPRPLSKFYWVKEVEEELSLFGCSSVENQKRAQFLVLAGSEYFVPLLFLNGEYREQLFDWFPDGEVFNPISKVLLGEQKIVNADQVTIILDEDAYDPALDHNINMHFKHNHTGDNVNVFVMSPHGQHYRRLGQNKRHTMARLPLEFKLAVNSDQHRLQDILTAANGSTIIIRTGSSLGELIGALANKPPLVINPSPCNKPSCCACRQTKFADPCYGRASLKAFANVCVSRFTGNHEYSDLFTRPDYIDACKSRVIGIQVVRPDNVLPGEAVESDLGHVVYKIEK